MSALSLTAGVLMTSAMVSCIPFLQPLGIQRADVIEQTCADMILQNSSLSYTVPVAGDCTLFAQCLPDGGYIMGNCSAGTLFDPAIGACQYSNVASCADGSNPCSGRRDGETIGDPRGCANFYSCNNGLAVPLTCPSGQGFDGRTCVPNANCGYVEQTTLPMSPAEQCIHKGMRPMLGDATRYLVMHAGGAEVEMPCAPGTVFDETCSCV